MSYQRSPAQTFEPEQAPLDAQRSQPTSPLLGLQRQLGNAAVQDLIRSQQAGPASAAPSTDRPPSWWDRAVDWTGEQADEQIDFGASLVSGVPVLGAAASGIAAAEHFAVDTAAGFARGAGDLVGGIGHMIAHPLDTAQGVGSMAMHIPGTQLWLLNHFGPSNANQATSADPTQTDASPQAPGVLAQDGEFWSQAGRALIEPYKESIDNGKTGEAVGRGLFDLGALFVGAGEVKATGKAADTAEVLATAAKADEPLRALNTLEQGAGKVDDLARAGNKAETWTKPASTLDEAADLGMSDDATRLADETDEAARALRSQDEPAKLATATQDDMVAIADDLKGTEAQVESNTAGHAEEVGSVQRQVDDPVHVQGEAVAVTEDAVRLAELQGIDPRAIEQASTLGMQISSTKFDNISDQAAFLAENVQGLTVEQASYLLEMSASRQGTVVFGGSRVRGAAHLDEAGSVVSDLDVGFKGLTPGQINKTMNGFNKRFTGSSQGPGRIIEHNWIYPGSRPDHIPAIESPEEFFMRSGIRNLDPSSGPRAGEAFGPSGFIAVTSDGRAVVVR